MSDSKLSRRNLFRNIVPEASKNLSQVVHGAIRVTTPRRRPPGALDEAEFLEKCTSCNDCVEACPHGAVHTLASFVGLGAGTPLMVPDSIACHMCEGFPCAKACTKGALIPPTQASWKLGEVRLIESRCLPFMGPECGACRGLCPSGEAALSLRIGRPSIDGDLCTGCGLCIEACPTDPKAIELSPLPSLSGELEAEADSSED